MIAKQTGHSRQTFWAAAPNELDTAASLLGTLRLLGRSCLALAHRVALEFQLVLNVVLLFGINVSNDVFIWPQRIRKRVQRDQNSGLT